MERSASIANIAPAFCTAQTQIKHAIKDSENPFFRSRYADLDSVWEAVEAALSSNSLAVLQLPSQVNGGPALTTTLIHSSGEYISETTPLAPIKPEPQAVGSAITYMRRYALAALMGVRTIDDDAEAAHGRTHAQPAVARPTPRPQPQPQTTPAQQLGIDLGIIPDSPTRNEGCSDWPLITIADVSEKTGTSANGKPWTKFGVKDEAGKWYGTFDTNHGGFAKANIGSQVRISYKENQKNPKFLDLVDIQPA